MLLFIGNATNTAPFAFAPNGNLPANQNGSQEVQLTIPQNVKKEDKKLVSSEKEVRAYFKDIPELIEVARCESHFAHTDVDGNITRGIANNVDVGVMQINERYHLEEAQKLGYDIYTLKGNMAYARYLYNHEGMRPWVSSARCWSKGVNALNNIKSDDTVPAVELALK